ncbi:MAG TPA: hypothetical protein EYG73_12480 [Arcobacter sp.]|nr:hypothetical protein [Arcobacter sp.]
MIQINNLTFSYNPREDRIFFYINHSDFNTRIDFIVTRKKLLELLNGFDEILINFCDNGKIFKQLYKEQEPLKLEVVKKQETKKVKDEVVENIDKNNKKDNSLNKKDNKISTRETEKDEKCEDKTEEKKPIKVTWEKNITTSDLNFTKNKEALILDAISYARKNNNITFKYISSGKQLAVSTMSIEMFQKTLSSMMRVIPFVAWGISPHILD